MNTATTKGAEDSNSGNIANHNGGGSESTFPARLHYMLEELSKDGMEHVVGWRPHGRAFMVKDQKAFVDSVLPLWFRQTKFSSFQRQLNLYGFKRISAGIDKGCHYHECFLRGMPSLSTKIQRTKVKGKGARKPRSPDDDPDFYGMPPLANSNNKSDTIGSNRETTTMDRAVVTPSPPPVAAISNILAAVNQHHTAAIALANQRQQQQSQGGEANGAAQQLQLLQYSLLLHQAQQVALLSNPLHVLQAGASPTLATTSATQDSRFALNLLSSAALGFK